MNPGTKLGLFLHLMLLMWTRGQTLTTETLEVYSWTNVDLSCSAPPDTDLKDVILEWTRSDLKNSDVFMFRDRKPYLYYQDPQFKGRIELKDPSLQSGDLSIILKNTALQDSGKYGCHVNNPSHIRKRSAYKTPPIKVINLKVLRPEPVEVYSRRDVVLSCSAPPDTDLRKVILKWTRSDLNNSNVFMFQDRKPLLVYQDPQFTDRIEVKDPSFKSGDLSIILRNTTLQDSGLYRCLFINLSNITEQSGLAPIKVIDLKVLGPEPERIQARPGQDVVLKMAPVDFRVMSFIWKHPEDQEHFVFLHGMGHPHRQHPQYKDRVELENQNQTPDQITDLSVILRRVQPRDNGTYNGYIVQSQQLRERNVHQSEPDKVIILEVTGGGCRFEAGFGFVASVFISLIFMYF